MPFKSKAQQRFMFATMPRRAKKWASETDFEKLTDRKPMPKLEDVYCLVEPFQDEETPWRPEMSEVEVSQHQAHLVDDDDIDPLKTGIAHDKKPLKFGSSSVRSSNNGV